jgi:acetyl-CoA/propionyl-CoA carboxylase carboxyl transferase subunit
MANSGKVFVTGPDVVRRVTGEQIDMDGLGGSDVHGRSGVVHITVESEAEAYVQARRLTGAFARPGWPVRDGPSEDRDLRALLPASPRRAYDVRPLVRAIFDTAVIGDSNGTGDARGTSFEELQPRWAANIVVGLGRLGGGTVGVVANNPLRKGGCLDSLAAEKAARFVRMCDSFGIPLLVIVDVPGYLPGVTQEWEGVVRRGAKLLHAFAEAVVPRVTLITRKSYGGAYIAMNSRSLGANAVFAWPGAEIAVMGAEAAVEILHRKKLAGVPPEERAILQPRLAVEHQRIAGGIDRALALGVVDEVIRPEQTRRKIIDAFVRLPPARGRHGNIPL